MEYVSSGRFFLFQAQLGGLPTRDSSKVSWRNDVMTAASPIVETKKFLARTVARSLVPSGDSASALEETWLAWENPATNTVAEAHGSSTVCIQCLSTVYFIPTRRLGPVRHGFQHSVHGANVSVLHLGRARIIALASAASIVPYTPTDHDALHLTLLARYFTGQTGRVFSVATSDSSSIHLLHSVEATWFRPEISAVLVHQGLELIVLETNRRPELYKLSVDHADRSCPSPRLQNLSYKIIRSIALEEKAIKLLTSAARQPYIVWSMG